MEESYIAQVTAKNTNQYIPMRHIGNYFQTYIIMCMLSAYRKAKA
jgi:hypothetical protein